MQRPAWMQKAWAFTGLNTTILILMVKGALPPTIATAAFQGKAWAHQFTTVGYLVAIMALLSLPIQTRAKFLQAMFASVFLTCLAAACSLLEILCICKAREHTTHEPSPTQPGQTGGPENTQYNASASTVAALFLIIYIYMGNLIRAYRPALMISTVQFNIFIIVASVYGPVIPSISHGEAFVRKLLYTFLTGFALATGVSLLVFPMTSRTTAMKQAAGILGLMKAIFAAHKSFMDTVLVKDENGYSDDKQVTAQAKRLQSLVSTTSQLYSKMKQEIRFARKEPAFGRYEPKDFKEIENFFKEILLPMVGLSTLLGMTGNSELSSELSENSDVEEILAHIHKLKSSDWIEIFELSAEPYSELQIALSEAIDHISYVLQLVKQPKSKKLDKEAEGIASPQPGDIDFAQYLQSQIERYHQHRQTIIQRWGEQKGVTLPPVFWQDGEDSYKARRRATFEINSRKLQQQLYLQLFAEFVIYSMASAVLKMVMFADEKRASGCMRRRKLINPGWRRIRKLVYSSFRSDNTEYLSNGGESDSVQIWMGDALKEKRDPEHLPAETVYERATDKLRAVPRVLASPQSVFAARAALSTISIGIIAYLRQSWEFFIAERGIWSLIMVSISMGANTGIGLLGFGLRIAGTIAAMVAAIAIWYMADGKAAAMIPLLFIWLCLGWWYTLKQVRYMMVGVITMVTSTMIIAYELQIKKIGIAYSESVNRQKWWPIYILAPLRVVAVIAGIAVSFFWTYFPYPVTTHTTMRKDLGAILQHLAHFYSAVHSLLDIRMHQGVPVTDDTNTPDAKVEKARQKVLDKCVLVLAQLREHNVNVVLEPQFGGKFPKEKYEKLIDSIQKIFNYLYLISYAANSFVINSGEDDSEWIRDFREFTAQISITSHRFTSILCQVSASILNSQPLPPYLHVPKPEPISNRMFEIDPNILSLNHVHEPSYGAFAALTVTSTLLSQEMAKIVKLVKDLVGEVDFSYTVIRPPESKHDTRTSRAFARVSQWVGPSS